MDIDDSILSSVASIIKRTIKVAVVVVVALVLSTEYYGLYCGMIIQHGLYGTVL